jgi:acyl dehydratase
VSAEAPAAPGLGKVFGPVVYAVGREKVREYAAAVGESAPVHLDVEAARAAGFADVVAPPMFCVVYAGAAVLPALLDEEIGIDFAHMVHGAQAFTWGPLVVAGDEITTVAECVEIATRGGVGFYVFETRSDNQDGVRVCTGTWTNVVRA